MHDGTAHVKGTGFPWQKGANVFIAGHRVGYPGTNSNLVFWDLDKLEKGDEILLTDADGKPTPTRSSTSSSSTRAPSRSCAPCRARASSASRPAPSPTTPGASWSRAS